MYEEFIQITGKEPGPTSVVLAGIHGNEVCGVRAFEKLLPTLSIERGTVLFGYGNPRAIEQNVRFTEANINRMFRDDSEISETEKQSYEYTRAQFLKKYLDQADVLLDIHASYTKGSRSFIICEPNAKEIVEQLPQDLVVTGFDAVEPGGTDFYMNKQAKIGICVECGYLGDPRSAAMAEKTLLSFLSARGHISQSLQKSQQEYIRMFDLYKTVSDKFTLSKQWQDFEEVSQDTVIGKDGEIEIKAPKDCVILFARNRNAKNEEAFLLGEKKGSLA